MKPSPATRHHLAMAVFSTLVVITLSWPSSPARACTTTTQAPAEPSGLTATANPSSYNEKGILLKWDAAAEADKVTRYHVFWGKGAGATLTFFASIHNVTVYYSDTDTSSTSSASLMETMLYQYFQKFEIGETYAFAVTARRLDNCGFDQPSEQSDTVTVVYQDP